MSKDQAAIPFKLRIPRSKVGAYANEYDKKEPSQTADEKINPTAAKAKKQGYLTPKQLFKFCYWKSPRKAQRALENKPAIVKELTRFAFKAESAGAMIGALVGLSGVKYPTASVILHFCVDRSLPILDWRALSSLGIKKPPPYTIEFWSQYVRFCRRLAGDLGIDVRTLDKALWVYGGKKKKKKK